MKARLSMSLLSAVALPAHAISLSSQDIDAICRVTISEAASEPVAGRAAVIDVILNRIAEGFAPNVQAVISSRYQFEPVMRVGGDWRRLPIPSTEQLAECRTILALRGYIADGVLQDLTNGATYFQNRDTVIARAVAGTIPAQLVDFGGMPIQTTIGHHSFYAPAGASQNSGKEAPRPDRRMRSLFVGNEETETHEETDFVVEK